MPEYIAQQLLLGDGNYLTMPASAGSSGQVLSFDGSGGITPATAAVQDSGTGRVDISQINDTAGLRIIGFDDQNDHELDFYIDSGGYANIDADQGFRYKQGGTNVSYISADGGNGLRMYDNIPLTFGATGATRFGFERNSVSGNLLLGYNEMNTTLWTVTPTGQLGIGATPSSDLHVEGTTTGANDGVLRVVNNTATAGHDAMRIMMPSAASGALNFSNNSGQYWRWFLGSAGEMRFDSNDGTSKFYMTNTGEARIPDALRVGSNASAASPLHVYQNDTATGSTAGITVEQDGTGHAVVQFLRTGSERWMIGVDGSNYFRITDGSSLGATDFFVVEPVTGYVGFGQAVPQSGIHCSTGARFDGQGISVGALTNSSTQGVIRCQTALDFYNGGRIEYDYAGTTGQVLTFENNGTEVMRLDGSGNVGIGDIAPATKLHVVGPDGAGTTPTLDPDTMSIFQNNGLVSDHCRVSIIAGASAQSSLNFGDAIDENAGYITYDHNVNKMYLRTNGAGNDLTISNNNQIGINETSPEATLHVVGPDGAGTTPTIDAFGTVGIFENNSDFASNSYISLIAGTDGLAGINFGDEDDENIGRIDYDHLNDELKFWTNTSQRMVITSSGSVGIGTASPTSGYRMTISSSAALTSGLVVEGSGNAIILDDINNYTGLGTADFTAYNGTNFAQFGTAAGHTAVFTGGNVGIGTQTPATLLTMEEAVSVSTPMLTIHANTSTTEAGGAIDFANSSQVSAIGARIASHRLGAGAYSDLRFSVLPSGGSLTEAMRIDSTGYVGIGDTAPGHLLEIADGFRTAPVSSPSGTAESGRIYMDSDDERLKVYANGADRPLNTMTPISVRPQQLIADSTSGFGITTRNQHVLAAFDDSTDEIGYYTGILPDDYQGDGLTVEINWIAATATSGDCRWLGAFERLQNGGTDLDADSFAADNAATSTTRSISGIIRTTTISFTDGADMDSIAAGDTFRFRVTRDADDVSDTMTGDAQIVSVIIKGTNDA